MSVFPLLTERQEAVLRFVRKYVAEKQVSPTNQEIGYALHISTGSVATTLTALENMGFVERMGGGRGTRLLRAISGVRRRGRQKPKDRAIGDFGNVTADGEVLDEDAIYERIYGRATRYT